MNTCFQIFKHEIKKILSDKKLLISMILMPVLVVFLINFLSVSTGTNVEHQKPQVYSLNDINVINIDGFEVLPVKYHTLEELKNNVDINPSDVVVDFSLSNNSVVIYYDNTDVRSYNLATLYEQILYDNVAGQHIDGAGLWSVSLIDTNNEMEMDNLLVATLLPYMLVLLLFQNTSNFAIDTVAGEKERGVFDKTLLAPVSPFPVISGKILSSTICGMISCIFYFGILFISEFFTKQDSFGLRSANLTAGMIVSIFLCSIILCYFVATLGVLYSLRAKTIKEAQSSSRIIFILVSAASLMSMFRTGILSYWKYLIPVYNICIVMQDVLYSIADISKIFVTVGSLSTCSLIVSLLIIDSFKKETINC